ncbi:MAG: hypothetical protein M0D53_16145 [Flavobacterium sp. JAD_PAG50586_2]|nr:MAG: hypothetical protein M0D53_16145 [Flavobacterium sp. JAD_PAG50586_2]
MVTKEKEIKAIPEIEILGNLIKKNRSTVNWLTILGVISSLIGVGSLIFSNYHLKSEKEKIQSSLKNNMVVVDSIKLKSMKIDSVSTFSLEFLNADKTDYILKKYYSPIIKSHYQKKNVPLNDILKNKNNFLIHYPRAKFIFKKEDIVVQIFKDNTSEVVATGLFFSDSLKAPQKIIYKLGIDNNKRKIFSIARYDFKEQF